ncbi:Hint domain-containing protein [uncultured Roseovarius sp.]|uniref:Hint domain-containing protein n=1 Tax=uncultured Roseovarius sp. TaxID=293344 RepID=UPI00260435D8|nr:Hint domain-containing protein [uncultured Roseovarius sp.]
MKPKTVGRENGFRSVTPPTESSGLMADSIILTLDGEVRVGDLCDGQRVITRDSGTAQIKAVRQHKIVDKAVRIKAGSLGHTRPDRDVTLPAGQGILVRDWRAQAIFGTAQAMVPVSQLIDGEFITPLGPTSMTIVEIEFDHPHILYVDGLEVAGHLAATSAALAA